MSVTSIIALQSIKGINGKCDFIREHKNDEDLKKILYYALNPLITYHISEKTVCKLLNSADNNEFQKLVFFNDIFECCEYLSRLRAIDEATLRQVKLFLNHYCDEEERDIYSKIISKSLRLGITAKTINKIIPNLIPEWEIQQSYQIEKYPIKQGTEFWLTQKLNGTRATFYNGQLIARSGLPYTGLEHIVTELDSLKLHDIVLDGELILRDKGNMSDNEAFRVASGIINSDSKDKTRICFTIFDAIPIRDFESNTPNIAYSERRKFLDNLSCRLEGSAKYVNVVPVLYHGKDLKMIDKLLDQMVREDKEGLMLNLDVPYKRTRHNGILKIKRFYTIDLPVIRCEEGTGRLTGTLGVLVLRYKNNEVKVGSGFTDEQRKTFWENKDDIISNLCEVKYKEISKDKSTGMDSLQFPVFVRLRPDKSDISYD